MGPSWAWVRASTADLSGANEIRIAPQEELGDPAGFIGLVVADDAFDRRALGPVGDQRTRLVGDGQDVDAGADDLRGASVVDREAHDLDARKARLDLDEQRGIGTVEPVDRLRRIADQEQIVSTGPQQVDERMLERVEVLCFVDEDVTESPADGVGEIVVVSEVADGVREDVIEIDDPRRFLSVW